MSSLKYNDQKSRKCSRWGAIKIHSRLGCYQLDFQYLDFKYFLKNIYLFILFIWLLWVLVTACRIFSCSMWTLFFDTNCTWTFVIYLLIYFWLCWVFVSVRGLSLVAASGGHSSSRCVGLSLSRPLLLCSTGSRRASSVVVAHGPSCSAACGIFPDQGSNPCPLH